MPGTGKIDINGRSFATTFQPGHYRTWSCNRFKRQSLSIPTTFRSTRPAVVRAAQAGAVRLAISRALLQVDANLRGTLKADGLLRRDPAHEGNEKKSGQPGARKRFQFSKR